MNAITIVVTTTILFISTEFVVVMTTRTACLTKYAQMLYTQGGVDVRDAASSTFLTEVAATLKDLQARCGNDFSAYLQSTAMPATELPSSTQVGPWPAFMPLI